MKMKSQRTAGAKSVDDYLASVPADVRKTLQTLRKTIRAAAPKAEEVISYNIPAFSQHGVLVYYAAFKDHCSLFPGGGAARRKFARELKPFTGGKGTVHFTPQKPLPAALVTQIVKARVAENEARASKKAR